MSPPTQNTTLRDFPYPYKALLAICSDLDETPDYQTYVETLRYLNTKDNTTMGQGVGLEVGNTMYFSMPEGRFSYWNANKIEREKLCELMRSGHIDCLHSMGDTASARADACQVYDELIKKKCELKVWIDHAIAPTNLGKDIMRGGGDIPDHPAYHSDLLVQYGIEYVWRGRVSSVIGQNVPLKTGGIWNVNHPICSGKTLAKELVKHGLAALKPQSKYSLHRGNKLLRQIELSGGKPVHEFIRSNPHWGGVSCCDTGRGIGEVLTKKFLDTLKERRGTCILYTHLGKLLQTEKGPIFPENAHQGFKLLAKYKETGDVLVSTTRRLLDYQRATMHLKWSVQETKTVRGISVETNEKIEALQGLTFYVDGNKSNQLFVNNKLVKTVINPADEHGKPSISIPWHALSFPS